MSKIGTYFDLVYHRFLFNFDYETLQQDPDDRELLAITFDHGVRAVWALDELKKEDKELSDKVHKLSKEIREKKIGREDAPYLLMDRQDPPEF